MQTSERRIWSVVLVGLGLAIPGCQDGGMPLDSGAARPEVQAVAELARAQAAVALSHDQACPTEARHLKAEEDERTAAVHVAWRVIGPLGGYIHIRGNVLWVPPRAVAKPTLFYMEARRDALGVSVSATTVGSLVHNDRGAAGFERPVRLYLTYERTSLTRADEDGLVVLRYAEGNLCAAPEEHPTTVDPWARTVRTDLWKFSAFIIAMG